MALQSCMLGAICTAPQSGSAQHLHKFRSFWVIRQCTVFLILKLGLLTSGDHFYIPVREAIAVSIFFCWEKITFFLVKVQ